MSETLPRVELVVPLLNEAHILESSVLAIRKFLDAEFPYPWTILLADNGSPATNMHFQEGLEADGLVFDYRLRPGPAHTRNALLVMEREGYPPLLMAAARKWLAGNGDAPTNGA